MSGDARPAPARRPAGRVIFAGLGGYLLGAASVLFIVWAYGGRREYLPAHVPRPAAPGLRAPPVAPLPGAQAPFAMPPQVPSPSPAAPGATAPSLVPAAPGPATSAADTVELLRRHLFLPVQGVRPEQLHDNFDEARGGGRRHEALDILAPRNTPVLAVESGRIAKVFYSNQGGNTLYQFDPTETFAYYYAHLERYADGIHEGTPLQRGQLVGYVGTSGNAPPGTPHLHFAIFRLGPDKSWWRGTAINPFPVLRTP